MKDRDNKSETLAVVPKDTSVKLDFMFFYTNGVEELQSNSFRLLKVLQLPSVELLASPTHFS
jgi:hypothetical protein